MTWKLAPALTQLMAEVNAQWPNRSRAWDGTIGDYKHSLTTSEHNPYDEYGKKNPDGIVRAVDITAQGIDVPTLLKAAIGDPRVHYVIYQGRICSRTYGWTWLPSKGHEHHIHISLRNNTSEHCDPAVVLAAQNNTTPWFSRGTATNPNFLEGGPMDQNTKNELAKIRDGILDSHLPGCGTLKEAIIDTTIRVRKLSQDLADVRRGAPDPEWVPLNQEVADTKTGIRALAVKVDALESKLDAILKALGNADAR